MVRLSFLNLFVQRQASRCSKLLSCQVVVNELKNAFQCVYARRLHPFDSYFETEISTCRQPRSPRVATSVPKHVSTFKSPSLSSPQQPSSLDQNPRQHRLCANQTTASAESTHVRQPTNSTAQPIHTPTIESYGHSTKIPFKPHQSDSTIQF